MSDESVSNDPAKQADTGIQRIQGRFPPGVSGNPHGRKPKALATVEKLRTALAEELPEIIASVVKRAKDSDISASKLILERVLPPLKATEATVVLEAITGSRTEQGQAILAEMAQGVLTPSQAAQLMAALAAQARIAEVDEFEQRLTTLEEKLSAKHS